MLKSWNLTSHSFAPSLGSSIPPNVANRPSSDEGFRLRNRRRSFRYHTKNSVRMLEQKNRILRWMCLDTHTSQAARISFNRNPRHPCPRDKMWISEWKGLFLASSIDSFSIGYEQQPWVCVCEQRPCEKLSTPTKKKEVVKQNKINMKKNVK